MEIRKAQVVSFQALNFLGQLLLGIVLLGKTEVANFKRHSIFVNEDVSRLDVSMDKVFFVNVL